MWLFSIPCVAGAASTVLTLNTTADVRNVAVTFIGGRSSYTGGVLPVAASILTAQDDFGATLNGNFIFSAAGVDLCTGAAVAQTSTLVGGCQIIAPLTSVSTLVVTAAFSYQQDLCVQFAGARTVNVDIVDLSSFDASLANFQVSLTSLNTTLTSASTSLVAEVTRAKSAEAAELARATAAETAEFTRATAAEVAESSRAKAAESAEMLRATAAESACNASVVALASRVTVLELSAATPRPFIFYGLSAPLPIVVSSSGSSTIINILLKFNLLLAVPSSSKLTYVPSTGVVLISSPGIYRLDANIHLYNYINGQIGTGVVAWTDLLNQPLGPNILNPNGRGVNSGTPGDDTIVSTIVVVPSTVSVANPFKAQLVLVSMNQNKVQVTDASTISVTQL